MKNKILIIVHVTHLGISIEECLEVLPFDYQEEQIEFIEVRPFNRKIDYGEKIHDWQDATQRQTRIFEQKIKPWLRENPRVVYFSGNIPIPLMLHLGSLLADQHSLTVFTRSRDTKEWYWNRSLKNERNAQLIRPDFPTKGKNVAGNVILRVSVSRKVQPVDTQEALEKKYIEDFDMGVATTDHDVLSTQEGMLGLATEFVSTLNRLKSLYNDTVVHLFASVPTGLAFLLGSKISPTMHPPVQTYQAQLSQKDKYQPAILINTPQPIFAKKKKVLILTADHKQNIEVTKEANDIKRILEKEAKLRDDYTVEIVANASFNDLIDHLNSKTPVILHIASHGELTGPNLVRSLRGSKQLTTTSDNQILDAWEDLFRQNPGVKCVILNNCYSAQAAQRISKNGPYVIGFTKEVDDIDAIRLSQRFYASLGSAFNIERAFCDGKLNIGLNGGDAANCNLFVNGQRVDPCI